MFLQPKIALATMHSKEEVIAPLIKLHLNAEIFVPNDINTDFFGTFSGEIERQQNALETLRLKCNLVMDMYNVDVAIASEGSFGPHPIVFISAANEELIMYKDRKNDLEIVVKELTMETNFRGEAIEDLDDLIIFSEKIGFPQHAIILRKSKDCKTDIVKGIKNENQLKEVFNYLKSKYGVVYAETDMRAMNNPTRMKVIERATLKLIEAIQSECPKCYTPGFTVTTINSGLPCEQCFFPTNSTLSHLYKCKKCNFEKEVKYPNKKQFEDPTYCDFCNP